MLQCYQNVPLFARKILQKIQTEEKLPVSGRLDQETLEKVNALIFSKYLQEDLSYQKAVTQLKEELKNDAN